MMDKLIDRNFDRVLYLDSDLLIVNSIQSLLTCDLRDYLAAAVADCGALPGFVFAETVRRRAPLGFTPDQLYFNSA